MTAKLVADVLKTVMSLTDDQVWIQNQPDTIPSDKGLYIVVGLVDVAPYAVNLYNMGTTTETRGVWTKETIQIDAFSVDTSAVTRLPEIIGALNSTFCQQLQETHGFKIASIPSSVTNNADIEGTRIPFRFTVTTTVLRAYNNTGSIDYFDTFSTEIHTEDGVQ